MIAGWWLILFFDLNGSVAVSIPEPTAEACQEAYNTALSQQHMVTGLRGGMCVPGLLDTAPKINGGPE